MNVKLQIFRNTRPPEGVAALVRRAQAGDTEAYGALVRQVQDRLWQTAVRLSGDPDIAADWVQETLLRAYRALPRLREPARFLPWALRILSNLATDAVRAQGEDSLEVLREGGTEPAAPERDTPDARLEALGIGETVGKALAALPLTYRQPLVLRHVLDLPYEEIAEILDMPLGTVKTRLFRGREMLRERLIEEGIQP